MIFLGIDPSIRNVGVAIFDTETKKLRTWTFHPTEEEEDWVSIGAQIDMFIRLILYNDAKKPEYLVIEYPSWQNSAKGKIAAVKGYTINLAFLVGYLCKASGVAAVNTYTPTPMIWKKNLPKDAVGLRFERRFGISKDSVTDHEYEAAMMIAWLIDSL